MDAQLGIRTLIYTGDPLYGFFLNPSHGQVLWSFQVTRVFFPNTHIDCLLLTYADQCHLRVDQDPNSKG